MNKLILLIASLLITTPVWAVSASPSATASPTAIETPKNKQVEDLKERLATKVAELRQAERRAINGTVKTVSISTLTIETKTKDIKIELTDEIQIFQFLKGKRTTLKIENVEKGDVVTVFGQYETAIDILKAKVIVIENPSTVVRVLGTVKEAKKSDYTITMETKDGKEWIIDFETATKTSVWDGSELVKGGFSKLTPGDLLLVTGAAVPKKENRVSAGRILNMGAIDQTAKPTPQTTEKVSSTSAAKESSPSSKATAKATPTPTSKP